MRSSLTKARHNALLDGHRFGGGPPPGVSEGLLAHWPLSSAELLGNRVFDDVTGIPSPTAHWNMAKSEETLSAEMYTLANAACISGAEADGERPLVNHCRAIPPWYSSDGSGTQHHRHELGTDQSSQRGR